MVMGAAGYTPRTLNIDHTANENTYPVFEDCIASMSNTVLDGRLLNDDSTQKNTYGY